MRRSLRRCSGTSCLGRFGSVRLDRIVHAHVGSSTSFIGIRCFIGQHRVLNLLASCGPVAWEYPKHRLGVTRWFPRSGAPASRVMQHER